MKKGIIGVGGDPQQIRELLEKPLKRDVSLNDIRGIPRAFYPRFTKTLKNGRRLVTIHGAAGEEDIPEEKLKVMTDPYDNATRQFFTECVLTDPIISPSLDKRVNSLFEDGFHLELIDATAKEEDNTTMTEGEKNEDRLKG